MEKARKAMAPLLSVISDFKMSCKNSLKLFHSFIRPIALYNSENLAHLTHHQIRANEENKTTLLAYLTKSEVNTTHQKFLKFILGVKRNCSNMATLGELGEFPLHMYGLISLLSFWHRISLMQDDTLVKQALNFVTNEGPNSSEWLATVEFLVKALNLEENFADASGITTKQFTYVCSKKVKKLCTEQWRTAITRNSTESGLSNKLRFYSLLKADFEIEPYLENVNDFHLRKNICKLRCSDHKLEIETGRHKNLTLQLRVCQLCNSGIESEMHFMALCPLYEPLRMRYLGTRNENDIINLLKCNDKTTAFNVGNYIVKAMGLREQKILSKNSEFVL